MFRFPMELSDHLIIKRYDVFNYGSFSVDSFVVNCAILSKNM
ncbi:MAG: hypothetical protein HW410_396 [Nitrosarchaeum sp.]|nr:hypothetical protein [Nitrosarchaeum sp.]